MRVLFTTAPLSGHFFPLVPLAWACRCLGHDVLVATSADLVRTVRASGLPATASGPAADFVDQVKTAVNDPPVRRRLAHGRALAAIAARNLSGVTSIVRSWRPDLVVSERAEYAGPVAAAAAWIPRVELRWGVAPLLEFRAAAEAALAPALATYGMDRLPRPELVLSPWPRSLRLPHAEQDANIRHVPYSGDARVEPWLLESRTRARVCVTFGTLLPFMCSDRTWDVTFRALELLEPADVECVLAVDDTLADRPLPAVVKHAGRMPLSEVLAGCDAVLHHGGNGTSLTALSAGCPQLIVPQFDDHFENAGAVTRAGAGTRLAWADFSPDNVAAHVLDLIGTAHFKQSAMAASAEVAGQPSPVEVVGVLERLAS